MSADDMGVTIYADGAASPNPGPGGYGVLVIRSGRRQELSGGFRRTTNNRMELTGAIVGLRSLDGEKSAVTIYSDSRYVADMFNGGYAAAWRQRGWRYEHPVVPPWHEGPSLFDLFGLKPDATPQTPSGAARSCSSSSPEQPQHQVQHHG